MPCRRPVKIVKQWDHPGTPRGTNILWTTITVNIWHSVSKLFRLTVLLIYKLFGFINWYIKILGSRCECPHFFYGSPKGYTKQGFGIFLWKNSHPTSWKMLQILFPKLKVFSNSVSQQFMVAPSLKNYLGLHCRQIPHRASGRELESWLERKGQTELKTKRYWL